jgi:LPXTG-site transpeptidase (sortase) family protein
MGGNRTKKNTRDVTAKPWEFLAVFLVIFFVASVILFAVDFVPEAPKSNDGQTALPIAEAATTDIQYPVENPTRIQIPAVGIDTKVINPSASDEQTLDTALLSGAARYPASALLGENARMFIFGHQSYLPVVHNQAFKAFNGLQKAKEGDEIIVSSATAQYHYRVVSVEHASADQALIELGPGERTLTLSTCDSFGAKTDRYVVRAEFVSRESTN